MILRCCYGRAIPHNFAKVGILSISGNLAPFTYKFGPTHRLIPIRITIIAIAVAAFFEAIQIT